MGNVKSGNDKFSACYMLRAQAVTLRRLGKSRQEVAKSLGRNIRWVQKWTKPHEQGGGLHDQSRFGRPSVLSSARTKDIISKAKGRRRQSRKQLSRRLKHLEETVSKNTVHHHVYNGKVYCLRAHIDQNFRNREREKRLSFAKKYAFILEPDIF